MKKNDKIFIAGGTGMVGSEIIRALKQAGWTNLLSNYHSRVPQAGVQRLLFLGSSCIYPKLVEQPMQEEALLTGTLESTNEPYAVAKIAGIKLCESYNRPGSFWMSPGCTILAGGPGSAWNRA